MMELSPDANPGAYLRGFAGGCLIGLASIVALACTKKIPGISGVVGRLLRPQTADRSWRITFVAGLILGAIPVIYPQGSEAYLVPGERGWPIYLAAGLLVGMGTRLGGGCTSGHGVCGVGMGARDSIVATAVFMAFGFATVFAWNWFTGLK